MSNHMLFPIPLIGQGTSEIESLPSYVFRAAYDHGVSVGVFLKLVYELSSENDRPFRRGVSGRAGIQLLSRVNRYSNSLRTNLSLLTGQKLKCEALGFLEIQTQGLSKELCGFRWCPECLSEMEKANISLYFKQLWHFRSISHCPLHRTPLASKCEHCGKEQVCFRNKYAIGHCSSCGKALSKRKKHLRPSDIPHSWDCSSMDLYEVFQKVSVPGTMPNHNCRAVDFMTKGFISAPIDASDQDLEEAITLLKELQLSLSQRRKRISLLLLRRIAYKTNNSLYALLSCSREQAIQIPLEIVNGNELPKAIRPRKKNAHNHGAEYKKIIRILKKQKSPPSLKCLARMAEVSVGYLEYRHPSLVRKVVDDHRDFKKAITEENIRRAKAVAYKYFSNKRYASEKQTRYQAYKVLSKEEILPKWILIRAIEEAYKTLIFDSKISSSQLSDRLCIN